MSAKKVLLVAVVATMASVLASARGEAGPIARRARDQQLRIAQGIRSGALTARETARLERRAAALTREVRHFRRANGGVLTPGERRLVNHQQNLLSRGIFREKHDRQHRR